MEERAWECRRTEVVPYLREQPGVIDFKVDPESYIDIKRGRSLFRVRNKLYTQHCVHA